jgi:hypothetical protein
MSNQGKVGDQSLGCVATYLLTVYQITSASQLNSVIFKDKAAAPVGRKFFSLFPGLGYAAGYKVGFVQLF